MKRLDKMLLINWHYIRHQILDFKDVNFLTGKNGAGKSTIIDALQLMMLGDTAGHFFNKAASERSSRTLKGYLRGEVAEDADANTVYLRADSDFTSYIVLEFNDTVAQSRFCLGIALDSYRDGDFRHRFFYLKDSLPPHHFYFEKKPMNLKTLRAWLGNHYDAKRYQFFDSNSEYRQVMAGVLGHLNDRFFRLFKKAVPFSPIMNIKQFITEFVCDTENEVDISHMQENIRQYKQLEEELAWVEKRVVALEQINSLFDAYREESNRLLIQQFLLDRAAVARKEDDLAGSLAEIEELAGRIAALTAQTREREIELQALGTKRDGLLEERARSDIYQTSERLKEKIRSLERELGEAKNSRERLHSLLQAHFRSWQEIILWCGDRFPQLPSQEEALSMIALLSHGSQDNGLLQSDSLSALKAAMDNYLTELQKIRYDLEREEDQLQRDAARLRQEITGLKQGIKPYREELLGLKESIGKHCAEANPQIFAELLEIRDPLWRDAIEGYLHTQKFYLLVEPDSFTAALQVYDRLKQEQNFYDLGLVDGEKILAQQPAAQQGSLAEEIETGHPLARAYADYLLGRVMKCTALAELRNHRTAITPGCMLYHNYVARQLHPRRYQHPYIGQNALARLLQQKEEQLQLVESRLSQLTPLVKELQRMQGIPALSSYDLDNILMLKKQALTIAGLKSQLRTVAEELGALDLSYLTKLDGAIQTIETDIATLRRLQAADSEARGEALAAQKSREESLPLLKVDITRLAHYLEATYSTDWRRQTGEPRFLTELKNRGSAANIIAEFTAVVRRTETLKQKKWEALLQQRSDYNRDFKGSFSPTAPENGAYDRELARLRDSLLLDYREKIQAAKERAQEQFREDFISKLRANIEKVEEQIKDINRAIKDNFFGRDRYRFTVTPNQNYRRFYEMITDDMLIEGFNLFSGTFLEKHGDTVEELFRHIVDVGEGTLTADQRQRLAENLERFTDYRTYLDFDMINIDDEGRESRLSRVLTKKSGGETQTPFYIAVLASFLQLYRVRQGDQNTLRLIVFDEAYSKMDHQRIQESIRLIRDLGLQVILSAPTEKIGDIAPLVDRNLCVIRVRQETVIKAFDPQELLEMGA